jgi:hypothetical protein
VAVYPQSATGLNYAAYPVGPTAAALLLTSSASTNTKGTYGELVASTSFESNQIIINVQAVSTANVRVYLLDIATGAAAAETDIIPNLHTAGPTASSGQKAAEGYVLPCVITSGTRISARTQCNVGSSNFRLAITLISAGGVTGISSFLNYGSNTSDSGAVSVDSGGTANVKGSYSELTSSTSAVIQWLMLHHSHGGNNTPTTTNWAIDLATGAAASEVVLMSDFRVSSDDHAPQPVHFSLMTYIAASTRIAIRTSCGINDANDRLLDFALLAATAPSESGGGGGGGTVAHAHWG